MRQVLPIVNHSILFIVPILDVLFIHLAGVAVIAVHLQPRVLQLISSFGSLLGERIQHALKEGCQLLGFVEFVAVLLDEYVLEGPTIHDGYALQGTIFAEVALHYKQNSNTTLALAQL